MADLILENVDHIKSRNTWLGGAKFMFSDEWTWEDGSLWDFEVTWISFTKLTPYFARCGWTDNLMGRGL